MSLTINKFGHLSLMLSGRLKEKALRIVYRIKKLRR